MFNSRHFQVCAVLVHESSEDLIGPHAITRTQITKPLRNGGRPKQKVKPWGGFEDWSASIREPLIWLGMTDPCETRAAVVVDDPQRQDSLAALCALHEEFEDNEFTAKRIIRRCKSAMLRSALECVAIGRHGEIDAVRLGWWLRRLGSLSTPTDSDCPRFRFTFQTELEVACTVYLVLRARKRRPSLYGRAVVRAFTIQFAQSVGVRLESGKEQEPLKRGKDQRSTRLLQMTQRASSYMKNREMLKSAQPLCQGSALTN